MDHMRISGTEPSSVKALNGVGGGVLSLAIGKIPKAGVTACNL